MTTTPPDGRGSLEHVMDELEVLAGQVHPSLSVHRWWRPDMSLPALWHWMPDDSEVEGPAGAGQAGLCRFRVWARILVVVTVDPSAVLGEGDMLQIEAYHDLALPLYAGALYARNPLGQREARMRGARTTSDVYGGVPVLNLELPLEVALDVNAVPPTP